MNATISAVTASCRPLRESSPIRGRRRGNGAETEEGADSDQAGAGRAGERGVRHGVGDEGGASETTKKPTRAATTATMLAAIQVLHETGEHRSHRPVDRGRRVDRAGAFAGH